MSKEIESPEIDLVSMLKKEVKHHQQKIDEANRRMGFIRKLCTLLPSGLPSIRFVHMDGYLCEGVLKFDVASREKAVEILEKLPGVPVLDAKGTFRTIAPRDRILAKDPEQKEYPLRKDIAPFHYTLHVGSGFHTEELEWWWQADEKLLLHVEAEVKAYTVFVSVNRDSHRYEVRSGQPVGQMIKYWGEQATRTADGGWVGGSGHFAWTFEVSDDPRKVLLAKEN